MRDFFIAVTRTPLSLLGAAITTVSAILIVVLFLIEWLGSHGGPYVGILAYLILPGIFLLGLLLIPAGVMRQRRRERRTPAGGAAPAKFPVIDLNVGTVRNRVLIFLALTAVNAVILATATYKGVEVMDSTEFCGNVCHSVMAPEMTTYQRSPHARVHCVSCHIGPGADWFVKSKLSGAWQLVSTTLDLYPRPIPTPVHSLRPTTDTCEQCHWPTKFIGDKLSVLTHYSKDEANTELKTVLLLRIGGIQGRDSVGIHWHVDPDNTIRYRSDESRETIHEVELTLPDGTVKTFTTDEAASREESPTWRTMDCVDCHNRPTHIYRMPDEELDQALLEKRLDRSLPYLRREGERILRQEYETHERAREEIPSALRAFYEEKHPEVVASRAEAIADSGRALAQIYVTNVFPSMNIQWGTYPNHIGHERFEGCFRCHNDELATDDGEVIAQDCDLCHTVLAWEEEEPEILAELNP